VPKHIFTFSTLKSNVSYNKWTNLASQTNALTCTLPQKQDLPPLLGKCAKAHLYF